MSTTTCLQNSSSTTSLDVEPPISAWYRDRERELVESKIDLIRVLEFKCPLEYDWWDVFWESLDRLPERRRESCRNYRRRHSTTTLALVGCGSAKQDTDEPVPAEELYTSSYFAKKRRWVKLYADDWGILSAEHGFLRPRQRVESYDTHIDDVRTNRWAWEVEQELWSYIQGIAGSLDSRPWPDPCSLSPTAMRERLANLPVEIVLLAGKTYRDPLADSLAYFESEFNISIRSPFEATSGIGDQQRWLTDQIEAYPGLEDLDESTAIRIDRDWAAVPLYLVRHTSGHVATVASRDGRTDQPWRLRVHNDVELPRMIESALTGDDPTLVPRSSVPDVEAVEWATAQRRLAAWGV